MILLNKIKRTNKMGHQSYNNEDEKYDKIHNLVS